jgi:hypothetical protein
VHVTFVGYPGSKFDDMIIFWERLFGVYYHGARLELELGVVHPIA